MIHNSGESSGASRLHVALGVAVLVVFTGHASGSND